jgi:hypothetical protein
VYHLHDFPHKHIVKHDALITSFQTRQHLCVCVGGEERGIINDWYKPQLAFVSAVSYYHLCTSLTLTLQILI